MDKFEWLMFDYLVPKAASPLAPTFRSSERCLRSPNSSHSLIARGQGITSLHLTIQQHEGFAVNDVRGYRYGIPVVALAGICSLAAVLIGSVSQPNAGILPQCVGRDALGDGQNFIDLFWSCPDGYRLGLMSLLAAISVLAVSATGYLVTHRRLIVSPAMSVALKILLAGVTVGLIYLIGLYIYEFLYHHGYYYRHRPLHPAFLAGTPILASLMHFPNRWGILMAIPVFSMGFLSLILISVVTGIPLD